MSFPRASTFGPGVARQRLQQPLAHRAEQPLDPPLVRAAIRPGGLHVDPQVLARGHERDRLIVPTPIDHDRPRPDRRPRRQRRARPAARTRAAPGSPAPRNTGKAHPPASVHPPASATADPTAATRDRRPASRTASTGTRGSSGCTHRSPPSDQASTHWNVNGSIANTSRLVVSIATNSPGPLRDQRPEHLARRALRAAPALRRQPEQPRRREHLIDDPVERRPRGRQLKRLAALARQPARDPRAELHLAHIRRVCPAPAPRRGSRPAAARRPRSRSPTARGGRQQARPGRDAASSTATLAKRLHRAAKLGRLRLQPIAERRAGGIEPLHAAPPAAGRPGSPER